MANTLYLQDAIGALKTYHLSGYVLNGCLRIKNTDKAIKFDGSGVSRWVDHKEFARMIGHIKEVDYITVDEATEMLLAARLALQVFEEGDNLVSDALHKDFCQILPGKLLTRQSVEAAIESHRRDIKLGNFPKHDSMLDNEHAMGIAQRLGFKVTRAIMDGDMTVSSVKGRSAVVKVHDIGQRPGRILRVKDYELTDALTEASGRPYMTIYKVMVDLSAQGIPCRYLRPEKGQPGVLFYDYGDTRVRVECDYVASASLFAHLIPQPIVMKVQKTVKTVVSGNIRLTGRDIIAMVNRCHPDAKVPDNAEVEVEDNRVDPDRPLTISWQYTEEETK